MKTYNINNKKKGVHVLLLCVVFLSITSCEKDFGDINNNYETKLYEATVPGLFNGIISSLQKTGDHYRVPSSWLYQWNQQAAMFSESGYRLDAYNSAAWTNYYKNKANAIDIEMLIEEDPDAAKMTNISTMLKVLMAYKTLTTTLLYGDMPYTEAGKGFLGPQGFRPAYESQQSIMESAINDLTFAVNNLSTNADQVSLGSFDTLFGNDISKWIKFANSLRLRYAMVMREKDASFADPVISDALSKPLLAADEHYSLDPAVIPAFEINRSTYYRGNAYIRMGSTMWEAMSSSDAVDGSDIYDLRCGIFFEKNASDEWVPYPQNPTNTTPPVNANVPNHPNRVTGDWSSQRSNYSSFNVYFTEDRTLPQFLITGTQISFLKAEIYNRGIAGVSANPAMAETFYNEGITESVKFWYKWANGSTIWSVNRPAAVPTDTELADMLADPNVAYSATPATALTQIYKQSWISLINQPFEAWNLQRRTNNATPGVTLTTSLVLDFNRLAYPQSEVETNRANWTTATGGSDSESKKIWIQP